LRNISYFTSSPKYFEQDFINNEVFMSEEELQTEELQTTEEDTRERFIPIGKQEIVADLLAAPHWSAEEQQQFGEFCKIFAALYHYKFHSHLEKIKRCYTPFNPDMDIVTQHKCSDEEKQEYHQTFLNEMRKLLNNANYEELTVDDINNAINADPYYGVKVSVDLEDFADMITYYRGASTKVEYKRTWTSLFLSKKRFEIPIYKRIFFLLKFKTEDERVEDILRRQKEEWEKAQKEESEKAQKEESEKTGETGEVENQDALSKAQNLENAEKEVWDEDKQRKWEKKARKKIQKSRRNLPDGLSEEDVFIKLFKNIPRTDLEMLFPNQNVQLKMFDKIKLAITGGGGTIGGLWSTISKVAVAANPIMLIIAFGSLIGIIFRQIMNIFMQRNKYMMELSRNLYFHNLDNNAGVINYLIDMAEEEESKEAVLAYYFLHTQHDKDYTKDELDREIENYIQEKYGVAIDFEVEDGLRKLRKEGILIEKEEGILKVLDLHQTCACLDKQWDAFFNPDEE
jgi:hypothetical protein